MTSSSMSFDVARNYFNSLSTADRTRVQDSCEKISEYLDELDPSNQTVPTLSAHRKSELEKRVAKLAGAIHQILTPIPLSETIETQRNALRQLQKRLPLPSKELSTAVKNLHSQLRDKVYYAVWLASGCPYNKKPDLALLERNFPAFYTAKEGTLIEQIIAELDLELQLAKCKEEKNTSENSRLIQERDQQKTAVFLSHLKNMQVNHRQMKALFSASPKSVQDQLPKPPYYGRGFDPKLYQTLGAHYDSNTEVTTFRVFAPNAQGVTLNLTAFGQIEHALLMIKNEDGIWETQTRKAHPGRTYHFMVIGKEGGPANKKVDPFAFGNFIHSSEPGRENHESVVRDIHKEFPWNDGKWMNRRVNFDPAKEPMSIYEVHAPTWKKKENGDSLNWKELAQELAAYCKDMGYSHVELMAMWEHPQPISMGYQITNFFSLNSSMGSFEDFQYFVNTLHEQKIGVIADWVPAHFAIDPFALSSFDHTPLFEDDDPDFAKHPQWGTYEFDFKKQYTKDFLGSNLDFILEKFHIDGIRFDAVQSMLNLNYGRPANTRLNRKRSADNLDAKAFLRNVLAYVRNNYPGTLTIAEEAMGYPNLVRQPSERGSHITSHGIGFDMTWHMGFMNAVLSYMAMPLEKRSDAFAFMVKTVKEIDGNDDFRPRGQAVLPFSHDENANGKGTIFTKMAGMTSSEKFANGRLLLAYQLLRGGGPILDFMGNEFLQIEEWHGRLIRSLNNPTERNLPSVQWEGLNSAFHKGARKSRRDLLQFYRKNRGLHDQTDAGFSWIDAKDSENSVLSFHRRGKGQQFACIFNFSGNDLIDYKIPLPDFSYAPELSKLIHAAEVYNTDETSYSGEGKLNSNIVIIRDPSNHPTHLQLRLPPYSAIVLEEQFA